jgi:heme A synthase
VRLLAWCLPGLVFFQGLLGGARVLFDPRNFSEKTGAVSRVFAISHAVTALLTVGLLAVLVTLFSRRWRESAAAPVSAPVRRFAVAVAALVWLQALLGALVRQHRWSVWDMSGRPEGAEVAPYLAEWASGAFLSRMSSGWPFALNAAHRIGAALVALAVAALATMIFRDRSARGPLGTPAVALVAATLFQVFLGVVQIWFNANTHARNAHHLGGALVFCSAAVLALLACRSAFRETEARP